MLRLTKVAIKNFKSIEQQTINFNEYGTEENKSFTSFILGVNESGKSNILDAIHVLGNRFSQSYHDLYYKNAKEEGKDIEISGYYLISDQKKILTRIKELIDLPTDLFDQLNFSYFEYELILGPDGETHEGYGFELLDIDLKRYFLDSKGNIVNLAISEGTKNKQLTTKILWEILFSSVLSFIKENLPEIIFWKPDPSHLINDPINLNRFIENPSDNISLLNIFSIYGLHDFVKIKNEIELALSSQHKKAELAERLSESLTNHVNSVWKEHKVNFRFYIDGDQLSISVEDKDSRFRFFSMNQRSDGFKQFISLIINISAQNQGGKLKNKILLIDEPENHLHPSGIRYMRDELLKIGKDNQVLVSTHSHFMVDTTTMDRHWLMKKNGNRSILEQLDGTTSLYDEEVVSKAFGIQIMKELIPENIIIVEGKSDKLVLDLMLKSFAPELKYSIKIAGGSKVYGVASILAGEQFTPVVFLDADDEGIRVKAEILKNLKDIFNKNSVKTISDLGFTKIEKASLEDLYPREFVKKYILDNHFIDVDQHPEKPVIESLKIQDRSFKENDKQRILKTNLSNEFISRFNSREKLEADCPELVTICKTFFDNLKRENS